MNEYTIDELLDFNEDEYDEEAEFAGEDSEDDQMVDTNIGSMPLEDYLDIRAMQYGFDDYEDLRRHGFSLED